MTVSVLTGLALQAIAAAIVHVAIRGQWLRRPGAILLAMALLGHGITELMQWAWPGRNPFRRYISQGALDDWVLLASAAVLTYAIAYALTVRSLKPVYRVADGPNYLEGLRLRWTVLATVPLLVLTWQGRGALQPVAPGQVASREHYASTGIAGEFLVPLVAVVGSIVLVRYGTRWLMPLLVAQGIVLVVAGTRSMIVTACLLSLVGAALCGIRPSRRQTGAIIVLVMFFTFLISATRAEVGRETFTADQGASQRLDGLGQGLVSIASAKSREAILDDLVYRFDSNTYGTMVLESIRRNTPPVGLETAANSIMLVVPSFLAPTKLSSTVETRNEEAFLDRRFGIPQNVDWLPSIFGSMLGWFGPWGLFVLAVVLGLALGAGETFALRRSTTARWILAMGLAQSALLYAAGAQNFIVVLRGPLLIVAFFGASRAISRAIRSARTVSARRDGLAWDPEAVRRPTAEAPVCAAQVMP